MQHTHGTGVLAGRVFGCMENLSTLIRMESTRETQGKVTQETHYYISDEKQEKASYFDALAR
jgi:hypothetical protein